jgi:hypothetical protein
MDEIAKQLDDTIIAAHVGDLRSTLDRLVMISKLQNQLLKEAYTTIVELHNNGKTT